MGVLQVTYTSALPASMARGMAVLGKHVTTMATMGVNAVMILTTALIRMVQE